MRHANNVQLTSYGRLNGTGMYATLPAAFSLELIGKSKLAGGCWFKYDGNTSNILADAPYLMGIRCPGSAAAALQLNLVDGTRFRFGTDEGSGTTNHDTANTPATGRQWMHYFVSVDLQTERVRQWVNGVLVYDTISAFGATTFSAGAGAISYLGSDSVGTNQFTGWLRDFVVSFAPITNNMVWDLFTKGDIPPESYHWPCDDSRGSVLACYKDNAPYPIYDATLIGGASIFSLDVPKPPRITDRDDNYVWLDGTADYYTISDDLVNPYMLGSPILAQSAWAYLDRLPVGNAGIMFIQDSATGSAFVLDVQATGLMRAIARSRNSGFASVLSPPANHWANGFPIRQWFHVSQEADYANKVHRCWLNGRLVALTTATAWEDLNYQCTVSAGVSIAMGIGAASFPGKLGPMKLFKSNVSMTNDEAFALYAKDEMPSEAQPIIDFRIPNLIAPVDIGPYAFPVNPVSIAAPYGPKHGMFGGIGR